MLRKKSNREESNAIFRFKNRPPFPIEYSGELVDGLLCASVPRQARRRRGRARPVLRVRVIRITGAIRAIRVIGLLGLRGL